MAIDTAVLPAYGNDVERHSFENEALLRLVLAFESIANSHVRQAETMAIAAEAAVKQAEVAIESMKIQNVTMAQMQAALAAEAALR